MNDNNNHTLNIIVSRTETRMGSMIRAVIGGDYNHCSFYLDGDVRNIYGFSRRYREFWFTGCFTQENAVHFQKYNIYEIPLSEEQYSGLSERIVEMKGHVRIYNYLSALMLPAGISVDSEDSFICSTFVAEIIDKHTDIVPEKDVNLHGPMDVFELLEKAAGEGKAKSIERELPHEKEYSFLTPVTRWHDAPYLETAGGTRNRRAILAGEILDADNSMFPWVSETIAGFISRGWEVITGPEDTDFTRKNYKEYDRLICCGGDRVLSRCVNQSLKANHNVLIALIPAGTTNDFAKTLGISTDIAKAVEVATGSNVRRIDSGDLDGCSFAYVAGFGDIAQVSHKTSNRTKKVIGYAAYVISAIQSLLGMREYEVCITMDDTVVSGKYLMVLITNSHMVGGIKLWDQVSPDDGIFEVLLVKKPSPASIQETIETYSASKITIENQSGHTLDWVLDGEPGGTTEPGETSEIHVNKQSYSMAAGE